MALKDRERFRCPKVERLRPHSGDPGPPQGWPGSRGAGKVWLLQEER